MQGSPLENNLLFLFFIILGQRNLFTTYSDPRSLTPISPGCSPSLIHDFRFPYSHISPTPPVSLALQGRNRRPGLAYLPPPRPLPLPLSPLSCTLPSFTEHNKVFSLNSVCEQSFSRLFSTNVIQSAICQTPSPCARDPGVLKGRFSLCQTPFPFMATPAPPAFLPSYSPSQESPFGGPKNLLPNTPTPNSRKCSLWTSRGTARPGGCCHGDLPAPRPHTPLQSSTPSERAESHHTRAQGRAHTNTTLYRKKKNLTSMVLSSPLDPHFRADPTVKHTFPTLYHSTSPSPTIKRTPGCFKAMEKKGFGRG